MTLASILREKVPELLAKLSDIHEDFKELRKLNEQLTKLNATTDMIAKAIKKIVMDNPEVLTKIITMFLATENTEKKGG